MSRSTNATVVSCPLVTPQNAEVEQQIMKNMQAMQGEQG
jgi:hypothetical protein